MRGRPTMTGHQDEGSVRRHWRPRLHRGRCREPGATIECYRSEVTASQSCGSWTTMRQQCPPKLPVFDLATNALLWRFQLPADQIKQVSLFTNLALDIWGFTLVVFSLHQDCSWRVSHPFFYLDPLTMGFKLHALVFRWTDGIFRPIAVPTGPHHQGQDALLPCHDQLPGICGVHGGAEEGDINEFFRLLEEPRGFSNTHAVASAMDRNGVMFYNLVTQDAVCRRNLS